MYKPGWKPGRWSAICDRCGLRFHSSKIRSEWDNLKVCAKCWEVRNPQDFVKVAAERIVPLWTRPEPADNFLFVCTLWSSSGYADLGQADCARADNTTFPYFDLAQLEGAQGLYLDGSALYLDILSLGFL